MSIVQNSIGVSSPLRLENSQIPSSLSLTVFANSICIPRIESTIAKSTIIKTFELLNIGNIYRVIEIPFKDSNKYKRIIVKLEWNNSEMSNRILSRFQEGKNVKIVYNSQSPWFWICVPNRDRDSQKHVYSGTTSFK